MNRRADLRAVFVAVLACGVLSATQSPSIADGSGVQLAEPIAADANGAEAYVVVDDISGFAPDGGEAVFEPGSASEEVFRYDTVDATLNRLVGLHRDAAIAHPAGVIVGVGTTADPMSERPQEQPTSSSSPETETSSSQSPATESGSSEAEAASSDTQDPCNLLLSRTCLEVVTDTIGENLCNQDGTGRTCDDVVDDPCGAVLQNTCLGWIFEDVVGENPCNQDGTGRTCEDLVDGAVSDPCGFLLNGPCLDWLQGTIDSLQLALCGDKTPDQCTDDGFVEVPDLWDVVDPALDEMLAVDCVTSVRGPWRDDEGVTAGVIVRGFGKVHCSGHSHPDVTIKVCLDKKVAGVWQKIECVVNDNSSLFGDPHYAEARVAQGCMKSGYFRVRARGQATNATKVLDSDSAKSIAWINCENVLG